MTVFDARSIARGWLATAVACSKDDARPALNRTVAIESFSEGVRLISTDSYVLLHAWIPNVEHDLDPEPGLDEVPYATAVAIDPHGRAKSFLAHALTLAGIAEKDDAGEPVEVRLNLGIVDEVEESDRPSLEGMAARYVTLEILEKERLKLLTYEGKFPDWRRVVASFNAKQTESVVLSPDIVGRLAKLGKIHAGSLLSFSWGGAEGAAHLDVVGSDPCVRGLVMPCRWDMDSNRPREENEESDAELADA